MPDELPTLDIAAGVGAAVLLIRALQQARAARRIGLETAAIRKLLEERDLKSALTVTSTSRVAILAIMLRSILLPPPQCTTTNARECLETALSLCVTAERRRVQVARARDLVALAILGGLSAYASGSSSTSLTYALCAAGGAAALISFVLRGHLVKRSQGAAESLLSSASALVGAGPGPCPECGNTSRIELGKAKVSWPAHDVGIVDAALCGDCGYLEAHTSRE